MPVDKMRLLPSQGTVRSPGKNVAGVGIVGIAVGLIEKDGAFVSVGTSDGNTDSLGCDDDWVDGWGEG